MVTIPTDPVSAHTTMHPDTGLTLPAESIAHVVKEEMNEVKAIPPFRSSMSIWCIFLVLCLLSFTSAIDATIVTTSLPTITREIGGDEQYVWIANSFVFASAVPQPLYGQISNIFGRRIPILVAISLFTLGSGLAGGSKTPGMLISGRTIQGLGTGGLYVLSDIIICDIIPPRHRGPYLSAVISTAALGTTIGPIIGGALAQVQWRWIFWINMPISAVGLFGILTFLKVDYKRSPRWRHALSRVDFVGNAIFIPSMISIFFGLIMGGAFFSWDSWHIILPLILGLLGLVAFHVYQASRFCREPSMPPRLFKHRTSGAGFFIVFLCAIILQAISYFLPLYFQAVKGTSPLISGVYSLPFALAIIPFGGITGLVMSKSGRYIPLHWLGFAMNAVGTGLLSTLNESSSKAAWICYQILLSGGVGIILTSTLPSTLAPLQESDVAVATGTYSFVRSFGLVWGVTIAAIVFNSQIDARIGSVHDASVRGAVQNGAAYSYVSHGLISRLAPDTKGELITVYVQALRAVWLVVVAISCLGFCCVFIETHVVLREDHETDFGLSEGGRKTPGAEEGGVSR